MIVAMPAKMAAGTYIVKWRAADDPWPCRDAWRRVGGRALPGASSPRPNGSLRLMEAERADAGGVATVDALASAPMLRQ
jgi:hypothetical protein